MMVGGEMVFEEGKLEKTPGSAVGGEFVLPGGGFRMPVPAHLTETLAGYVGRQVVLGIRPEHFHLWRPEGAASGLLKAKINVVEPLGNDMDVYMSTTLNDHVVARVEAASDLQMDAQATMFVDLRKVHFFEPGETGMNLSQTNEIAHAVA